MKKLIALVLSLVCMLSLIGCIQQKQQDYLTNPTQNNEETAQTENEQNTELEIVEPNISIPDFSYAKDSAMYVGGEPGVKTSGFVNTTKVDVDFSNVAEVAKNECTIKWDSCTAYLDTAECIWKVVFYNEGTDGGDQTVYLDYDGKTVLIVYGE